MTIYEIDKSIEELIASSIDPDTGELTLNEDALEQLKMERDIKVENLALYIKNEQAFSNALQEEQENLKKRKEVVDRRIARLKNYLTLVCEEKKFQTAKVACKFTESIRTDVSPEFIDWAREHRPDLAPARVTYQADKKAIRKAIEAGDVIEFAELVPARNVTVG